MGFVIKWKIVQKRAWRIREIGFVNIKAIKRNFGVIKCARNSFTKKVLEITAARSVNLFLALRDAFASDREVKA